MSGNTVKALYTDMVDRKKETRASEVIRIEKALGTKLSEPIVNSLVQFEAIYLLLAIHVIRDIPIALHRHGTGWDTKFEPEWDHTYKNQVTQAIRKLDPSIEIVEAKLRQYCKSVIREITTVYIGALAGDLVIGGCPEDDPLMWEVFYQSWSNLEKVKPFTLLNNKDTDISKYVQVALDTLFNNQDWENLTAAEISEVKRRTRAAYSKLNHWFSMWVNPQLTEMCGPAYGLPKDMLHRLLRHLTVQPDGELSRTEVHERALQIITDMTENGEYGDE